MGLLTAWLAYELVKSNVKYAYERALIDINEMQSDVYEFEEIEPNTYYELIDGQFVDVATGEIAELPKTTEVTEEMEETARARHDLTAD
jgi:hypothetical protein